MLIYALFSQCVPSALSAGFGRKKLIQTSLPGLVSCLFAQNMTKNARYEKTKGWVWLQITLCPQKKRQNSNLFSLRHSAHFFFRRKIRKWKKKLSDQFLKIFQPLHTNLDVKKVSFFIKSCSIIMSTLLSKEKTSKLAFYLF